MVVGVLKHSKLNRKTTPVSHAIQHGIYISRLSACQYIIGINFSNHIHKVRRQIMKQAESVTRKNGVLCEKIMVTIPRCMTVEQRRKTVNRYIWNLSGQGRGRIAAFFHEENGTNPHVHVYWYDKDTNGKPVWGASEKNSTIKIRALWESICNEMLTEYGYTERVRMLRRPVHELLAQQQRDYELWRESRKAAEAAYPGLTHADSSTALYGAPTATKRHQPQIEPKEPKADIKQVTEPAISEEPMAYPQYKSGRDESLVSHVADICQWDDELRRVIHTKAAYAGIIKDHARTLKEIDKAQEQIDKLSAMVRKADHERGHAKEAADAIRVGMFSRAMSIVGYKTYSVRRKQEARERLAVAEQAYAHQHTDFKNLNRELSELRHKRDHLRRENQDMLMRIEAKWGRSEELVNVERELESTITELTKGLTSKTISEASHKSLISQQQMQQALGVINRHSVLSLKMEEQQTRQQSKDSGLSR